MYESGYTSKNLNALMMNRGLKNKDVAKLFGCTIRTVSRWRNGRATMCSNKWAMLMQS